MRLESPPDHPRRATRVPASTSAIPRSRSTPLIRHCVLNDCQV
jgi:hypothetical protein